MGVLGRHQRFYFAFVSSFVLFVVVVVVVFIDFYLYAVCLFVYSCVHFISGLKIRG